MAGKYYAVKIGKTPGIYGDWESCKAQVNGYPGAEYKSFKTEQEARTWLGGDIPEGNRDPASESGKPEPGPGQAIAYVDGSYSEGIGKFSYGVVFFVGNEELHFSKSFSNPELLTMRNVAGEIMGAGQAMKTAQEMGLHELLIYHDYEGIAKWCTGEWKTNKEWTKKYKNFYDRVSKDLRIYFVKVKAHSKDRFNDMADELAKNALEL